MPADGVPTAPRALGAAGKRAWNEARSAPWTGAADVGAITQLARAEDEAVALAEQVAHQGVILKRVVQSARGEVIGDERYAHPGPRELRRVDPVLVSLRNALGLLPASRARLVLESLDPPQPDALDRLREQRARRLARERRRAS